MREFSTRPRRRCSLQQLERRLLLAVDLRVELSVDAAEVRPGDDVAYVLRVTNDGPDDAVDALIEHDPSAVLDDVQWQREAQPKRTVDRDDLERTAGFIIDGQTADGTFGARVRKAGDVNGDGIDDVIVGTPPGTWTGKRSTNAYVIFGVSEQEDPQSPLAIDELNGQNGFVLAGGENEITSFHAAGDVNGDGVDDLVLGASFSGTSLYSRGRKNGLTYVVYGADSGFDPKVDLQALNGSNGFTIHGSSVVDRRGKPHAASTGFSVSGVGDFNGDGLDDVLIGSSAPYDASAAYLIFGAKTRMASELHLSDLDGHNGVRLFRGDDRHTAQSVAGAGDVNGDGLADVIVGSYGREIEAFVVYGSSASQPDQIDLLQVTQGDGFVFRAPFMPYNIGFLHNHAYGATVNGAGDFNGDGFDDVIVGAPRAFSYGTTDAGAAYVVFGGEQLGPAIDAASLDGDNGFLVGGREPGSRNGLVVESAGDVNQDGFAELIVQNVVVSSFPDRESGSYLIFGTDKRTPAKLDLASLDGRRGVLFDRALHASSAGDFNHDGIDDLVIGGESGSRVYVQYGAAARDPDLVTANGAILDGLTIPAGSSLTYEVTGRARADLSADAVFAAAVTPANNQVDEQPDDNHASVTKPTVRDVDLEIVAVSRPKQLVAGLPARFEFSITNNGATTAEASSLVSSFDALFTSVDWTRTTTRPPDNFAARFDISELNGANGFKMQLTDQRSYVTPYPLGDFNGDGLADIAVRKPVADVAGAGAVYIVFGSATRDAASYGPPVLGAEGILLVGEAGDGLGQITGGGDVNGDGFADLILSRSSSSWPDVILGGEDFDDEIHMASLKPHQGFRIRYGDAAVQSSPSVQMLGDVNGDEIDDFLLRGSKVVGNSFERFTQVVYGRPDFGEVLDLASIEAGEGFAIDGFFQVIGVVGDITADGLPDLAFGNSDAPSHSREPVLIVPGRPEGFPQKLVLADVLDDGGFEIAASRRLSTFGDSVAAAGDVNGDGIDDLAISGHHATDSLTQTSGVEIIFGSAGLATGSPQRGVVSIGQCCVGRPQAIGDINADGLDDLLIDGSGAYVVLGSRAAAEFDFTFAELDGRNGFEVTEFSEFPRVRSPRSIGDFNGDGVGDIAFAGRDSFKVFYVPTVTEQRRGAGDIDDTLDIGVGSTVRYAITGIVRRDIGDKLTHRFSVMASELRTEVDPRDNVVVSTLPVTPAIAGDVDADGQVGFRDFLIISSNFGRAVMSRQEGDLDGDGLVQFSDFLRMQENYGRRAEGVSHSNGDGQPR